MSSNTLRQDPPLSRREDTLEVSIIIPTYNRRSLLEKALDRLAAQTVDMTNAEVIVVLDGCSDGTAEMLSAGHWPFDLRVVSQDQRGAGAARNAGAKIARGPVLIFLDDDIMAAPELVEQYVRAHQDEGTTVGIGRLMADPSPKVPGWWRWLEWQLSKQYKAMQAGRRRVGGRSLYSGNFSVRREQFFWVGGFDESLPHSEDVELGLRLEGEGATFQLVPAASGEQWGHRSYESWFELAYKYGQWDGALAVNPRYPFAWDQLFDAYRHRNRLLRFCARRVLDRPWRLSALLRAFRVASVAAHALHIAVLERYLYAGIYDLRYWQGVCDEWGGARVLWRTLRRRE
jgi:glycosyltransferase involved in cell wall biosynthesis